MYWIYLLLAAGLFIGALRTSSPALMVVCLLAALGLLVAWVMGLYAARVAGRDGGGQMIDPVELHRLRAEAQARKAAAVQAASPDDPAA